MANKFIDDIYFEVDQNSPNQAATLAYRVLGGSFLFPLPKMPRDVIARRGSLHVQTSELDRTRPRNLRARKRRERRGRYLRRTCQRGCMVLKPICMMLNANTDKQLITSSGHVAPGYKKTNISQICMSKKSL